MVLLAGNLRLMNIFSWKELERSCGSAAIRSFIHSLSYFSMSSYLPGTVLGSEDTRIKDTQSLHTRSLQFESSRETSQIRRQT